jgi:hypothetical protein
MPHDHSHSCGDGCNDHDHIPEVQGHRDNLYSRIDRDNIVAFNTEGLPSSIIKPWHERADEQVVCY